MGVLLSGVTVCDDISIVTVDSTSNLVTKNILENFYDLGVRVRVSEVQVF